MKEQKWYVQRSKELIKSSKPEPQQGTGWLIKRQTYQQQYRSTTDQNQGQERQERLNTQQQQPLQILNNHVFIFK